MTGASRPSGTVTFLFTNIEGSTRLWDEHPEVMGVALARHDEILRTVIGAHGGFVFSTGGDGLGAAFGRAGDAVTAAIEAQQRLEAEAWPVTGVDLEQWQYAVTGGGRLWYCIDDAARTLWLVGAHVGHPKPTE